MAITVADKAKWEKAIEKAKAVKPHVKALDFGKFQVCGSKGDCYIVTWSGKGQEMKAECDCPAGKKDKACYHIPATSGAWKLQVIERAAARPRCNECSADAVEDTGLCEFHLELSELSKAFSTSSEGLPLVSSTVPCSKCGQEYSEADMTGPGYALICSDCLLFG